MLCSETFLHCSLRVAGWRSYLAIVTIRTDETCSRSNFEGAGLDSSFGERPLSFILLTSLICLLESAERYLHNFSKCCALQNILLCKLSFRYSARKFVRDFTSLLLKWSLTTFLLQWSRRTLYVGHAIRRLTWLWNKFIERYLCLHLCFECFFWWIQMYEIIASCNVFSLSLAFERSRGDMRTAVGLI